MKKIIIFLLFFPLAKPSMAQWDKMEKMVVEVYDSSSCSGKDENNGIDSFQFKYTVSYPFFSNRKITQPITDSLNKYVRVIAGNSVADSFATYSLRAALKMEMDTLHDAWTHDLSSGFCYNFENSENIEIIFSDKHYTTLTNNWWAYDGGAHGVGGEDYIVLETASGRKINSWHEIVSDTALLLHIAEQEFKRLKSICNDSTEWFWGGKFYLTNNFAVLTDGILFYYQTYEIAPYVFGPTELFLSWKMLKEALPKKKK